MYIYKVKKETGTGQKLVALLRQIDECDEAADRLAVSVGANAYAAVDSLDFGGIAGFAFPRGTLLSNKHWLKLEPDDKGDTYYFPKIEETTEWLPEEDAALLKNESSYLVEEKSVSFSYIQLNFTRKQAAEYAGIKLTTQPIERLCNKHNVPKDIRIKLATGIPASTALANWGTDIVAEFALSQKEDYEIMSKIHDKKFSLVHQFHGSKQAVSLFKKMAVLPTIPYGTTNALCQVNDDKHRCGVSEYEDYVYITAGAESACEEFEPVTEAEFQQVCAIRDAEAAARRMSKTEKTLN